MIDLFAQWAISVIVASVVMIAAAFLLDDFFDRW